VDSPKDFASKVFTLMRFALGSEPEAESAPASSTSAAAPQAVEAEVIDPNDPWKAKN
jgi:hypothetical protein